MDAILLEERARTALQLGESHFREFKSGLQGPPEAKIPRDVREICRDVAETLVAFANADGGELLVGIEDDGTVTGIERLSQSDIDRIVQAPKVHVSQGTPLPAAKVAVLTLNTHKVAYFAVTKGYDLVHQTSDGKCLQRRDLASLPIPSEQIRFDRQEIKSREYDRQFVDGANATHLETDLVAALAKQILPGMSIEKCLQYLDLAEYGDPTGGLRLRRAALLLFGKQPERWHPRLQVRIIKVKGTELGVAEKYNVVADNLVRNNLVRLVEESWLQLRPHLVQTRFTATARFESILAYPEQACREAIVNAIAHRDLSEEGAGIEVYVFDDRIEVKNPGGLLAPLRVSDLKRLDGAHQSRNSLVSRVLREFGYMRELGEGMRRIFELMKNNELTEPEIISEKNTFNITLRHKPIYTTDELVWLEQFSATDLTQKERAVIVLGKGGRLLAAQDIFDRLGIVDTEEYRQIVDSLQKRGVLQTVVSRTDAKKLKRKQRLPSRQIPKFQVGVPGAKPRQESRPTGERDVPEGWKPAAARIYVGGLSTSITSEALLGALEKFGQVAAITIPRIASGTGKGFAYCDFHNAESASAAIEAGTIALADGRIATLRREQPRIPSPYG